ncbi:MAG TPA: hypothetical protein ENN51_09185 [candidate division WOR-3 bacterium]|uniref:Uncharacterized protein n=1 Tax=candidate division WOR-3 bacterium TaxID=2052148 RepID=A0A7V0T772_UNCW3|nr:hypothetical protein [candidate division WOR-3 bacterium]
MPSITVSFHFGLWECLPAVFRHRGHDVRLVVGKQRDRALGRALDRLRASQEVRRFGGARVMVMPASGCGPEPVRGEVRRGLLVGFMLDNTSRGQMTTARAGGVAMRLPAAPYARARKEGVRPLFCTLEAGRLRVRVYPPGDENHALGCLLAEVRRRPEDWVFWGKAGALAAV